MKLIELTKGYSTVVDDCDYEWLSAHSWRAKVTPRNGYVYVRAARNVYQPGNKRLYMLYIHRAIWERHNGPIPEGLTIDHIEHGEFGALDNRLRNLRLANAQQQMLNRRRKALARDRHNPSRQYRGVSWKTRKQRWVVQVTHNGKTYWGGSFLDEMEAAQAFDRLAREFRPNDLQQLNFPT